LPLAAHGSGALASTVFIRGDSCRFRHGTDSVRIKRQFPRREVRCSVYGPDGAVRYACHLSRALRAAEMAGAHGPESHGRRGDRVPARSARKCRFVAGHWCLAGDKCVLVHRRTLDFPAHGKQIRGHHLMKPILEIRELSKQYHLGARSGPKMDNLRELLQRGISAPLAALMGKSGENNGPAQLQTFWALKDVSFDVHQGDVLGVIGRNGAGKSTLLKILSRITSPTSGHVAIRGRLASLLEVGTGFHPELTGRENIFLNGAILGMRKAEIRRHFDEIVAFAEVEKFLDTPVKHYSSGMYVRLAFAVAAHLEPEILIVDEVLAVGDAEFQKKCLGKMHEASRGGRTVLFVSHSMAAIRSLCTTAVLLKR